MARKMTPQAEPQGNPVKALELVDSMVQDATEAIMAMAKAAQAMLALDAQSLMTVAELLTLIGDRCADVQNCVNYEAETCGANHTDDERRALSGRLYAQHQGGDPWLNQHHKQHHANIRNVMQP